MSSIILDFQSVFDTMNPENGYSRISDMISQNGSQIRFISQNYNSQSTPIWKQSLFLEDWIQVEVVDFKINSPKAYLRSDQPLKGCIYYLDVSNNMQKQCFSRTSKDDSTILANVNAEIEIFNKVNGNLEYQNLMVIVLKDSVSDSSGRLLQSGANLYVSEYQMGDDYEVYTETTSLEYFFYIGLPIICILLAVVVCILVVCIFKKRKSKHTKQKKVKKDKNPNSAEPSQNKIEQAKNPNTQIQSPVFNPQQNPTLNLSNANMQTPKISNPQMQMVYVMQVPINVQNGSNYSNQTFDSSKPRQSKASRFSGNNGSETLYPMPFPPINVEQNHYNLPENAPEGNDLKINSVGNLPDEDEVPVFEVNLEDVDKYGAQQKFS